MGRYDFEEGSSDRDDGDDLLQDDIQALSRVFLSSESGNNNDRYYSQDLGDDDDDDDDDEDLRLVRSIKEQYGFGAEPLSLKPLTSLPPVSSDDEEDDFETLRAIQRRFKHYGADATDTKDSSCFQKLNEKDAIDTSLGSESLDVHRDDVEKDPYEAAENVETSGCASSFPTAAQTFIEAIKKNRSCQKFIRNKMLHIEARMEDIKELQKRMKTLRDFQVQCKKKVGRALSQKQDARVQLISAQKPRANTKGTEKNISSMCYGPMENSHVALYRDTLKKFPLSFQRDKWSKKEIKDLEKEIIHQFQGRLFEKSAQVVSAVEEFDLANGVDGMISSINDLDITPELIQDFSRKVDWNGLASGFPGRAGAECEARWLNHENRLINRGNWTSDEDKHLLLLIQSNGIHDWSYIAEKLETNRTPFQCLTRYQRSLNASILKRDWTEEEDAHLRSAVEVFGESNWQAVASVLEGRTGTQCSNRWNKTLLPARQRVGRWSINEDKRLRVAATLFGHKSWHKFAKFVPGRTQAQCRERWVNVLDPSLNRGEWTEEDDSSLKVAIAEHGYCWSKVAVCVPLRTDNQCRRRWKQLFPNEVPLLKAARDIKKAALISNFVDRESERPALGANDFVSSPITDLAYNQNNEHFSKTQNRKVMEADPTKEMVSCCHLKRSGSRKRKSRYISTENYSDCDIERTNADIFENKTRKASKSGFRKKKHSGKSENRSIATEALKSCESTELDENKEMDTSCRDIAIKLRSRRSRGVRLKNNPPISPCGIHDTPTSTTNQYGSNQSSVLEILHGQSTYESQLSKHDEEPVSELITKARKKRSSKLQLRKSLAQTTVGDNNYGAMQLRTSSNGNDTHSVDAADPSKQNDINQLEKSNLYTCISVDWEDLPLSNLFNIAVARIQKRRSRSSYFSTCAGFLAN